MGLSQPAVIQTPGRGGLRHTGRATQVPAHGCRALEHWKHSPPRHSPFAGACWVGTEVPQRGLSGGLGGCSTWSSSWPVAYPFLKVGWWLRNILLAESTPPVRWRYWGHGFSSSPNPCDGTTAGTHGAHCSRCWGQWIETHLLPKGPASAQSESTVLASQLPKCAAGCQRLVLLGWLRVLVLAGWELRYSVALVIPCLVSQIVKRLSIHSWAGKWASRPQPLVHAPIPRRGSGEAVLISPHVPFRRFAIRSK